MTTTDLDAAQAEIERLRGTCEWQLENDRKATESIARLLAENERLRAALTEITELELEGDASLDDAMRIADEVLNP